MTTAVVLLSLMSMTGTQGGLTARPQGMKLIGGTEAMDHTTYCTMPDGTTPPDVFPKDSEVHCYEAGKTKHIVKVTTKSELRPCPVDTYPEDCSGVPRGTFDLYQVEASTGGKATCNGSQYGAGLRTCENNHAKKFKDAAVILRGYKIVDGLVAKAPDAESNRFLLSCFDGAVAKCLHLGYVPGVECVRDGTPVDLVQYMNACIRAARANYDADDTSYTCTGLVVDFMDDLGIQQRETAAGAKDFRFEGEWNSGGIVPKTKLRPRVAASATADCPASPYASAKYCNACPENADNLDPDTLVWTCSPSYKSKSGCCPAVAGCCENSPPKPSACRGK